MTEPSQPKPRGQRLALLIVFGPLPLIWVVAWLICYRPDPKPAGSFAEIQGKKICYRDEGQGPVLLLIHGSAGSIEDWEPTRALLVRQHRVIVVDRPGQGHSDWIEGDNQLVAQADALAALLRQRTQDPAILIGHSYGGGMALTMALRHPDQVRGVVHVAGIGTPGLFKGRSQSWAPLLRGKVLGPFMAQWIGRIIARRVIRQTLERAFDPETSYLTKELFEREFALWSQPRNQIGRTREIDQVYHDVTELWPQWPAIKAPVYLLAAKEDRLVPLDVARDLFRQIPDARIQVLANASHMLPITQPKAIAAAVNDLESGVRRAQPSAGPLSHVP